MAEHNLVVTGFSRYDKAYMHCGKEDQGLSGCGWSRSLGWTPTVEAINEMKQRHDTQMEDTSEPD